MFQSFSVSETLCHSIYDLLLELIYDWAFLCQHVSSGIALCIAVHSLCSLQEYYAVAEGFQSVRTHWRWWSAQTRGSLFSAHKSGENNGGTSITPSIPFIGPQRLVSLVKGHLLISNCSNTDLPCLFVLGTATLSATYSFLSNIFKVLGFQSVDGMQCSGAHCLWMLNTFRAWFMLIHWFLYSIDRYWQL